MGGNITWVIRKADRSELRMERWTNIFPYAGVDPDFLAGDEAAFDRITKQWFEMKADWEANKETKNFKFVMTDVYAPYPALLAPSEYGIIVHDFVSKTILSANKYTRLVPCYKEHTRIPMEEEVDYEVIRTALERAYTEGRLSAVQIGIRRDSPICDLTESFKANVSFDDLIADIYSKSEIACAGFAEFRIDLPRSWTGIEYSCDFEGMSALRRDLFDRGFQFSPEDESAFDGWLREDEDEDVGAEGLG